MIPQRQRLVFRFILFEFMLLNLCVLLVLFYRSPSVLLLPMKYFFLYELLPLLAVFNLSWGLIILSNSDPNFYVGYSFKKRLNYITINTFIFIGLVSTCAILFKIEYFNRTVILAPIFLFSVLNLILFNLFTTRRVKQNDATFGSKILVVGGEAESNYVADFTTKLKPYGYAMVGVLNNNKEVTNFNGNEILGELKDLPLVLDTKNVDEIFISGSSLKTAEINTVIKVADSRGVRVNFIPETPTLSGSELKTHEINGLPIFQYRQTPLDNFNNFMLKRLFDTVFSLLVLILLSPLFFLIGLLVKLESRGPMFYKPVRKGEAGNTFECFKFRTMSVCDDPLHGTQSTVKDDPRITRIGKYLRKYDLDELPQFYNVLKGDMSVVGPRPHRINLQYDFRKIVNDYMVRHYVRPGITGWAQVNGWRGPTVTVEQKKERIKFDLWYIENWSFILDVKIVFLTVFGKKSRQNAF